MQGPIMRWYTVYIHFKWLDGGPIQHKRYTGIRALSDNHASAIAKAVACVEDQVKEWDIVRVSCREDA